jgi:hypothetical protein
MLVIVLKTPELEKHYYLMFFCHDRGKENDIFARNLINRPYGTGRVFLLFSRHFVPGYLRFDPSGINA